MALNSYENEQENLQRLMDETLDMSDEDIPEAFGDYSEDDYIPNETSSESSSESEDGHFANRPAKKSKIRTKQVSYVVYSVLQTVRYIVFFIGR